MSEKNWGRSLLGVCLLVYLGYCLPQMPIAADDIRMVEVFSMDEASAVAVVRYLFLTRTWTLETFSYGGLFYYLPVMMLHILHGMGIGVDDQTITVVLRGLCTFAGVGSLWLVFHLGRQIAGEIAGVLGAWLLMLTPTFLRWSIEIHPDVPQVFWLLCALSVCLALCRDLTLQKAAWVGLFAGLAFGTKYSGIFLLPVIGLAIWLAEIPDGDWKRWILGSRRRWFALGLAIVVFGATFGATNFSALIHWDAFQADVGFEREHLAFGHEFRASDAGLRWLWDLAGLAGLGHAAVFVLFLGWLIYARRISAEQIVLLAWMGVFTGYLIGFANLRASRHLLPVLPCLYVIAAAGYQALWGRMRDRRGPLLATAAIVIAAAVFSGGHMANARALWVSKYHRASGSDEIEAGRWLREVFEPKASILYHAYAYVPDVFRDVFRASSMDFAMVNHFEPDVLVIREGVAGRYADLADAERAQKGREAFLDQHYFYSYLRQGFFPDYALKRTFGNVAVYQRTKPRDPARSGLSWFQRVELFGQGRLLGASAAFAQLAQIHQSHGHPEEAERLRKRMREASGGLERQLAVAVRALRQGKLDDAERGFEAIRTATAGLANGQRASVALVIGRAYLETGHYDAAIAACKEALALNPDFREALFDLGFFYFLSGDERQAEVAYAEAIARFGADARAASLLKQMIADGMRTESARRLLDTHFSERVEQ